MAPYGHSRTTTASPERVWSLWSDPANWNTWNTGIRSVQLDRGLTPGSRGTMTTTQGGAHRVTIRDVEPPRRFTLEAAIVPLSTCVFRCEIMPSGSGSTIAQHAEFSGPLSFIFGPIIGPQMARNFVSVLDDLARASEA